MLLPEGVYEKPGQPDEDDAGADAHRVKDVHDICVLFCPEVQICWVHVDPSNQD
jgi:hypothetical protein